MASTSQVQIRCAIFSGGEFLATITVDGETREMCGATAHCALPPSVRWWYYDRPERTIDEEALQLWGLTDALGEGIPGEPGEAATDDDYPDWYVAQAKLERHVDAQGNPAPCFFGASDEVVNENGMVSDFSLPFANLSRGARQGRQLLYRERWARDVRSVSRISRSSPRCARPDGVIRARSVFDGDRLPRGKVHAGGSCERDLVRAWNCGC